MKRKSLSATNSQHLCSELGPEDGVDPRDLVRGSGRKRGGRKTQQLCAQVAQALNYALSSVCDDEVLRDLLVFAVQPAPDESRLLVTVTPSASILWDKSPTCPDESTSQRLVPLDLAEVMDHLRKATAKLRAEVAASIHRKRVPELTFAYRRHEGEGAGST